jgi:hypothetical protein
MRSPFVAAFVLLLVAACGSSSDPSPAAPPGGDDGSAPDGSAADAGPTGDAGPTEPVTREQYRAARVAATCDLSVPCCAAAGKTYERAKCEAVALASYDERKNATFDPDMAAKCMRYLAVYKTSGCNFVDSFAYEDFASCSKVFTGTAKPGEACKLARDCAVVPGKDVDCSDAMTCIVLESVAIGGTCAYEIECDGGYCDTGGTGKCQALPAAPDACRAGYCAAGNYCDDAKKCQPTTPNGSACVDESDECVPGSYCKAATCAPLEALGNPCASPLACAFDLLCTGGKCAAQAKVAVGAACKGTEECPSMPHEGVHPIECSPTTKTCGIKPAIGDVEVNCGQ